MKEKMLKKLKSVKFWLSLSGAVVIVLQLFGLKISAPYVNEVVSAICSVFVILGIMVPDNRDDLPGEENESDNQVDADGAGDGEDFRCGRCKCRSDGNFQCNRSGSQ